ncbi:MAG: DUF4143 domain-containing protein, partial [Vicinamibacterales bacterium]|nr:DUF4143 domain-containing protein [Vicinamibacterales bacterium]
LLETVFLVYRLPAWSANFGQRLVKAPKLYVMDTGLACHLLSTEAKRLDHDRSLFGRLLETFVVGELRKQMSWVMPTGRVYHFRSSVGAEVDVVIERTDGDVAAVEVKAGATVDASCFRGLTLLRDRLGTRFLSGVVLHTGERTIPFGDRLWAVPIQALWAA